MNVPCPSCNTVFRVDPAKVPAEGVRARCTICRTVFRVAPDGEELGSLSTAPARATAPSPAPPLEAPAVQWPRGREIPSTPPERVAPPATAPAASAPTPPPAAPLNRMPPVASPPAGPASARMAPPPRSPAAPAPGRHHRWSRTTDQRSSSSTRDGPPPVIPCRLRGRGRGRGHRSTRSWPRIPNKRHADSPVPWCQIWWSTIRRSVRKGSRTAP